MVIERSRVALISVVLVALWMLVARDARAQPQIERPVTDEAGVLTPHAVTLLEQQLRRHRRAGHAQIAVLIVRTTSGIPIADYANGAATLWGGGSAADDGVLFVLAIDDREMHIEVGYGLEEAIPDSVAMEILDGITSPLRAQRFDSAVRYVVDQLIERTAGAPTTAPEEAARAIDEERAGGSDAACFGIGLMLLVFFGGLAAALFFMRNDLSSSYDAGGSSSWAGGFSSGSAGGLSHRSSHRSSSWLGGGSSRKSSSSSGSSKPSRSHWGGGSSSHKPSGSSHKPSSSSGSSKSYSGGGGKFGGGGASKRW